MWLNVTAKNRFVAWMMSSKCEYGELMEKESIGQCPICSLVKRVTLTLSIFRVYRLSTE
jgi:hypothetical protein